MARHFRITIDVAYDEATVPKHMEIALERNVEEAIGLGLLADPDEEAVVETHTVTVEEITNKEDVRAEIWKALNDSMTCPDCGGIDFYLDNGIERCLHCGGRLPDGS